MTVLVMSKYNDDYYLHADGRMTSGSDIISDFHIKVFQGKEVIIGYCGDLAEGNEVKELLLENYHPIELLDIIRTETKLKHLTSLYCLVISKTYGMFRLCINGKKKAERFFEMVYDDDLPYTVGSGAVEVGALLEANRGNITPQTIRRCIKAAYRKNNSIGGKIREVRL